MEKKIGYIVLQVGFEYNDEYYHTGSYGETYEAPKKAYLTKEKAEEALKKELFNFLRGEDLGRYGGCGLEGICHKGMEDEMISFFKKEFNQDIDDYEMEIPGDATDEQLEQLIKFLDINFFELVEVELE